MLCLLLDKLNTKTRFILQFQLLESHLNLTVGNDTVD